MGVWRWAERARERMNERQRERERVREREDRRGNRSKLGTSPPDQTPTDAGTDQTSPPPPSPDLNTHTYPTEGPGARRGETQPGAGGQRSGVRQMALFLFCLLPEMTKKKNQLS